MANAKEILNHIRSVEDTRKITNAMYLISSTKLRKAKQDLDRTRPYFNALRTEIKRAFRTVAHAQSPYLFPEEAVDKLDRGSYACLVITADKGLAGAYNLNAIHEAERLYSQHRDTLFFVVGEYGRRYFERKGIPVEQSFLYTAQNPTMQRAREIQEILLDLYESGRVTKLFVIYTDTKNELLSTAQSTRLLPFHRSQFELKPGEKMVTTPFEFIPSVDLVLSHMVRSYVGGFIYSALVDSFCSEQSARMTAMRSANDNAEKILADLRLRYNRMRQAQITQEIIEVSAGTMAQKQKREAIARKAEV